MLDLLREKIKTAQDKDIEDKKGTQPKRYYAKDAEGDEMSKSTKDKRASHFAKNSKKADDDDSAYKPAPVISLQKLNHPPIQNNSRRCLMKTHVGIHMSKGV